MVKFVYIIATSSNEYIAMLLVSVLTLRRTHATCDIHCITTQDCHAKIADSFPQLVAQVDHWCIQSIPYNDDVNASRYLKSHMRKIVSGDFVYLDCDTIIIKPLFGLFKLKCDLAAVPDLVQGRKVKEHDRVYWNNLYNELHWHSQPKHFINTGVLYIKDNPRTQFLGDLWAARWLESARSGHYRDQVSFNAALADSGASVILLDYTYNGMVTTSMYNACNAKIWHFIVSLSNMKRCETIFDLMVNDTIANKAIDWNKLDQCIKMNYPWLPPFWPSRLWATGNYFASLWHYLAKRINSARHNYMSYTNKEVT